MALFNPSRDQVRQFFFDSWARFKAQQPLSDLEKLALDVIHMHPEYQAVLDAPERYREQEYFPEMGETNPFLHMSLHLSILEQIAIDQPPGIAAAYAALLRRSDLPCASPRPRPRLSRSSSERAARPLPWLPRS